MRRKPEVIALHALPPTVLGQTVERLTAGQKVNSVAQWLMTQHRGVLQHQPFYIIRKHVGQLKFCMAEQEQGPAGAARKLKSPTLTNQSACRVVPSPDDGTLRELEDVAANADRVTGKAVLLLTLCELRELLGELQHKGGQEGTVVAVLQEMRRIAETMFKFGAGLNRSAWEDFDFEDWPRSVLAGCSAEELPEVTRMIEQVKEMDPADRMLGLSILGMAEEVVRLERELAQEARGESAAPPPESEPKP